ncbi:hypothetical protein A6V37_06920 [Paraburkholderia ginsengiterrae]|uniref:Uncharacterized protein n=1 Tax=Paraburkholderia ginsengiterrae TaxID=1462993 RepID=A0A1A9N1V4_9BURK|nr:hypothetical protein A6V37_06920 [Paraburkholderia ginsengiterrae]
MPVVAPEPHLKSRTPSDSAIVAIFQDKRKPQNATQRAFPLDFMGNFLRYGDFSGFLQGGWRRLNLRRTSRGKEICPYFRRATAS